MTSWLSSSIRPDLLYVHPLLIRSELPIRWLHKIPLFTPVFKGFTTSLRHNTIRCSIFLLVESAANVNTLQQLHQENLPYLHLYLHHADQSLVSVLRSNSENF